MKKAGILNASLSRAIAMLGHGQSICIGDAGLPVPEGRDCIDLAVTAGVPTFLQVLTAITQEMHVERAVVASELTQQQGAMPQAIAKHLEEVEATQAALITQDELAHEAFKRATESCAVIVRTGECTPYSNIILYSGVVF